MNVKYPPTVVKPVEEEIFGIKITDNYRWLEESENQEVREWIEAQNLFTRDMLDQIKDRNSIQKLVEERIRFDQVFITIERENGWFFIKKHHNKQQPVLYFRSKEHPEIDKALIDTNELDSTGFTSLSWFHTSHDGSLLVYGLAKEGSDWSTGHIMEVETGKHFEEKIERTRGSAVRWKKDKSGFYYTRHPKKGEVPDGEETFHSHIRYHVLGTNPENDPIIFENPERLYEYPLPYLSKDETFMIIMSYRFIATDLYFIDLSSNPPITRSIIIDSNWMIEPQMGEECIYFLSNHESPKYGVYKTTSENLDINQWECVISPGEDILQNMKLASNKIIALWLHEATSILTVHNLDGIKQKEIPVPKNGTVIYEISGGVLSGEPEFDNLYFDYQSFTQPPILYEYNIPNDKLTIFNEAHPKRGNIELIVSKVWYPSKDGTKVHMFIIHPKHIELNGNNPTILYGYGGFNISITPFFSPTNQIWFEKGGILAYPNIRGGGEFGEEWHKAGILGKKQNVFDDFIAAAEYLIKERYTSPKRLAINGASNGGLLVGAVCVQRPDLFEAVYCNVPLLDMTRYNNFSLGKTWIPEYGDPEKPEDFNWLYAYSPYHHVKQGTNYPAVLLHTATEDSRVDPSHAMKMAALLQKSSSSEKPVLLWVEGKAGHGLGKPISALTEEYTNILSFFTWRLNQR
ncbi:MAG: prolyl oligopeptidase family serine peptidase [Promethearchaeota archaeon]|jgi:prolyl oligopeptidase